MINILTGPVHSGKTTFLKNAIPVLREKNFRIDGYLSESIWENEELIGYNLLDLKDNQYHPFIRKQGQEDWQKVGPFFFVQETLTKAQKIILRAISSDLCVVDEVGPLELSEKGVWPSLKEVLILSQPNFFLVVRNSILENFLSLIEKDDIQVFSIEQENTHTVLAESLMQDLEKRRRSEQK